MWQKLHILIFWPNEAVFYYHKQDVRLNRNIWVRLTYSIIRESKLWMHKRIVNGKMTAIWCKELHFVGIWDVLRDCNYDIAVTIFYFLFISSYSEQKSQNVVIACNLRKHCFKSNVLHWQSLLLLDNTGKKKHKAEVKNWGAGWWK